MTESQSQVRSQLTSRLHTAIVLLLFAHDDSSLCLLCALQLTSALNSNDTKSVNALVQSGTPIHDLSAHSSHTPLQHALALSSPQPLRSLLSAYFASSSTSQLQERDAVLDTLTQHLNPSFTFSSSAALEQKSPTPSPAAQSASSLLERVERALAAIRRGEFVVVTDGEDRENEGDLIIDAQYATAERIAYMVNETSGIICVGLSAARAQRLQLPPMVERNTESHQTAFTVTVDYNRDPLCSTGISAYDRAATIRALASDETQPAHFNRPGHVFPLVAKDGGVLERPGHTEASVELSRLSGGPGVGVMCELVRRDGAMMRPAELVEWSRRQGWELISIAELIEYRKQTGK